MIKKFITAEKSEINEEDWRDRPEEFDPDDEELYETPEDIVTMLGFDPKEFSSSKVKMGLSRSIK